MTTLTPDAQLFQVGSFALSAGMKSWWKLDCDALSQQDWGAIMSLACRLVGAFGSVEGVPRGGLKLADMLRYDREAGYPLLIVDDVLTTGASMERQRAGREAKGFVLFARGPCLPWVKALFTVHSDLQIARGVLP